MTSTVLVEIRDNIQIMTLSNVPARNAATLEMSEAMGAERAHAHGLINRLTEPGQALEAALELARTVAANGPLALIASKRVAQESADWPQAEMFERQSAITTPVFTSQDAREGAAAFAEKRLPVWRGL